MLPHHFPFASSLTVMLCLVAAVSAQNAPATQPRLYGEKPAETYPQGVPPPAIRDRFTADPHCVVIGDTYYIYPTVDKEGWRTTEFNVWSSKDLITWKNEGVILDLAGQATGKQDVSWARSRAWAPGAVARDGKVYDYFCGEGNIGVAVADKPTGPFKDALGKPLIARGAFRGQMIDPYPFIDEDGQAYLYWGNGGLYVAKLGKDMISFDGEVKTMTPTWEGGGRFNEGIAVNKRNGTYYFSWSENDARSPDYRVGYGTSKSPFGPIEVAPQSDRIILQKSGLVIGTGHHSIINVPNTDRWYIIYHRHAVPGGSGFIRETCISRMEFEPNPNGGPDRIKPVDVTTPAFPPGSKGEPLPSPLGTR